MDSQHHLDQTVGELNFHLFNRSVHPELFNIYESRHFLQGDYEVMIWSTGCSHVISVHFASHTITELICSDEQLLPSNGLIETFKFSGKKNYQCKWSLGFGYMMNSGVEPMSHNLYKHTHRDLKKMGKKRGILVEFPELNKSDFMPFSYIDYEAKCDELHIYTYHALPESQTVLKTQSLFDFRNK